MPRHEDDRIGILPRLSKRNREGIGAEQAGEHEENPDRGKDERHPGLPGRRCPDFHIVELKRRVEQLLGPVGALLGAARDGSDGHG